MDLSDYFHNTKVMNLTSQTETITPIDSIPTKDTRELIKQIQILNKNLQFIETKIDARMTKIASVFCVLIGVFFLLAITTIASK